MVDVILSTVFYFFFSFTVLFSLSLQFLLGFCHLRTHFDYFSWLLTGMATTFFLVGYEPRLERCDTRVFSVWRFGCGALYLRDFFLSQHGICVNVHPRQPSIMDYGWKSLGA
jgi:hypothetical protein